MIKRNKGRKKELIKKLYRDSGQGGVRCDAGGNGATWGDEA